MTALSFPDVTPMQVLTAVADVAIVAFLVYQVMSLFKGTQAVSLIKGLAILFAANALAGLLKLDALHWLLRQVTTMTFVGIPIVFQPEIRKGLDRLGRGRLFGTPMSAIGPEETRRVLAEVCRAAEAMSREYTGSLIVMERDRRGRCGGVGSEARCARVRGVVAERLHSPYAASRRGSGDPRKSNCGCGLYLAAHGEARSRAEGRHQAPCGGGHQ